MCIRDRTDTEPPSEDVGARAAVPTTESIKKDLRYSKIMIMTDQDVDGSHIKGLIFNWLDAQWPELLHNSFITSMITPIIKAKKKSQEVSF